MFRKENLFNLILVLCIAASMVGCGGAAATTESPTEPPTVAAATEVSPTATGAPQEVTLEVAVESAGYGLDLYTEYAREFEALHPGVTVNLWGVPELWKQLQPRFIAGDTPDLVAAVQGIDHATLISENQIMPLNDILNSPAEGQPDKKFIDTVIPGLLDGGKRSDNYYLFPWNAVTYGVFYNEKLFEDNGWKIPETWDDLLALCDQVKATGIACVAFPGVYPEYFTLTAWWDLIDRIGGREDQLSMENLVPGAWNSASVVESNTLLRELVTQNDFQDGWQGQDHTASQTLFVTGKAAMNFNGSWLESEMKNITPADFKMGFFPVPGVKDGKGNRTDMRVGSDWWFIPTSAKQPDLAGEFLKFVFSKDNASKFVETTQSLSPIEGSSEGVQVSATLSETMAAMESANSIKPWYWGNNYYKFYDLMATDVMGAMLRGEITPQEMADKLEALAEEIRNDSTITKVTVTY
jgi:N-acetylglucosamine transport system substrate-binding protein